MSDVADDRLSAALDALLLADRLLVERDNVHGPDSGDAKSFYTDDYVADWQAIRVAIANCCSALGREPEFAQEAVVSRM